MLTAVFFIGITVALGVAVGGFTVRAIERTPTPRTTAVAVAQPVMLLSPTQGAPGTMVSVASAGWVTGEVVLVRLGDPQTGQIDGAAVLILSANERGEVNGSFAFPTEGRWALLPSALVVLQAASGSATTSTSFGVVAAPLPVTQTPVIETPVPGTTLAPGTATAEPTPPAGEPTASVPAATVPTLPVATPTLPAGGAGTGVTATVTGDALNVRRGPGTQYGVIASVTRGAELEVLGQNSEGTWLQVVLENGTLGWVARSLTDFAGAAPIVATPVPPTNMPPPPTETATATRPALTATATRPNPSATATATRPNPTNTPTQTPVPTQTATPAITAWRGEYWNNRTLSGSPALLRNDNEVSFDWGTGSPASALPSDDFSARWTRSLAFEGGSYRFTVASDDGVRVWIDDAPIIAEWSDGGSRDLSTEVALAAGTHSLRVEYYERTGTARIRLSWEKLPTTAIREWRGEYWANVNLSGTPALVRNDRAVDFNWGSSAPAVVLPADSFSAR